MSLKDNLGIIVIIISFIFANLIFSKLYNDIWWDSSVYIGMGKYIYSSGKSGLWEESRPLILPLILGIGWKLNFNLVYFSRIVSVIFSILVILMTYKIGFKLFSKKIGLMAAFFIAFSYTFLFFSPNILTEIPSMLFVLLVFYFFLKNKFFLMGLFSGMAVMTRLFQIFTLIGLYLVFFAYFFRKSNFYKKLFFAIIGISIFIIPYFFLNYYLYNDILLPFKTQGHLTKTTGWMLYKEFWFYFNGLLKENYLLLFLFSIPFFLKRNYKFYALALAPLIYFVIFSIVKHKEMRFMLVILPFLYLLLSYCLYQIYARISYKRFGLALFFVMVGLWLTITFVSFKDIILFKSPQNEGFTYFQDFLKNNKGNIWISNPLYSLYSDSRIDGLLYFYSSENLIKFIDKNKDNVNIVLFNNCDIPCPPKELDSLCEESKKIIQGLLSKFTKVYQKEVNSCNYEIFKRTTY